MSKKNDYPVYPPFNPLDKKNLTESVTNALLKSEVFPLPPNPFIGAGVYVLYYTGDFPAYKRLAELNRNGQFGYPIYVGKAGCEGTRKGSENEEAEPGLALYKRLKDHAKSITAASNLNLEDFYCRFLSVDDIWIPLAESLLIKRFKPIWNVKIDGFGNHDPGSGRYKGKIPMWDCLHPGRAWAQRLQPNNVTAEELEQRAKIFLRATLILNNLDDDL